MSPCVRMNVDIPYKSNRLGVQLLVTPTLWEFLLILLFFVILFILSKVYTSQPTVHCSHCVLPDHLTPNRSHRRRFNRHRHSRFAPTFSTPCSLGDFAISVTRLIKCNSLIRECIWWGLFGRKRICLATFECCKYFTLFQLYSECVGILKFEFITFSDE